MKEWIKISDLLFFQEGPGVRNTQYTQSGVKLLNVANLVNGKVDLSTSDRYISEDEAYGRYKHFLCDDGDFIIASSGIKVEYFDRKMGFVDSSMLPLCMNTSTIRFKVIDSKRLNIKYFMYYLKSIHFKQQLSKFITGSAQLNFGPSHLKKMNMPLVSLKEQNDIVEKLSKVELLLDKYNGEIKLLDELIKARFVEMFGDVQDAKKNSDKQLKDICNTVTGGTPSTKHAEYYNGTIPWISTVSLGPNYIDGTTAKAFITQEAVDNSSTKIIPSGSILFGTRVGVGKSSINQVEMCTNQDIVAIIDLDESKYNKLYIKYVLDTYQSYFDSIKKGATILGISSDDLKNIYVPDASLYEQDRFEKFVKQIDKSRLRELLAIKHIKLLLNDLFEPS